MSVEVHLLRYGDSWLVPYVVRHYLTYADKVVLHDAGGEPLPMLPDYRVVVVPWDCPEVNDLKYAELRNNCWKGSDADWCIVADLDELIYFPEGAAKSLGAYTQKGAAVIRPHGFEMFSEEYPRNPYGQIYDEIKQGAPDDKWYAKPILFSPKLVRDMRLGVGSHEADPVLHDDRRFHVGQKWPFANPPCYLLHFHQIGPAKDIGDKYDANQARMAAVNKQNGWGNHKPGIVHVQEKRDLIVPNLRQVIP
jgi:hypothetical protein